MSFFPRFVSHNHEFTPLFRLLDDFATVSRGGFANTSSTRAFIPKFDVREVKDAYELHGELPGIDQKDVQIQWEDSQTISIKGRVEQRSERGERPSSAVTAEASTPAVEDKPAAETQEQDHDYHTPSVEDEFDEVTASGTETADTETAETTVAKTEAPAEKKEVQKQNTAPVARYWVTERSVGEFHRSFSFPGRVDQDGVKASLKNGILSVVVPKTQIQKPRYINVE